MCMCMSVVSGCVSCACMYVYQFVLVTVDACVLLCDNGCQSALVFATLCLFVCRCVCVLVCVCV